VSRTEERIKREIEEILASRGVVTEERLTAKRVKDFRDSGLYELRDASGAVVAMIFRDPGSRDWYEENLPGAQQTHFTERWRGSSQAEAIASILRRRASVRR